MRRGLHQMQELVNVTRPAGQNGLWIGRRTKAHNVGGAIYFRVDTPITDHTGNLLLQLGSIELQKLCQARSMYALVINRHDTNVVLNDTPEENLVPMRSEVSFRESRKRFQLLLMQSGVIDDFLLQE